MKNVLNWIYGLLAAIIGAAANGVLVVLVAPESFNLNSGLNKLLSVMLGFAIVAAAMYLKQSPLPPKDVTGGNKPSA